MKYKYNGTEKLRILGKVLEIGDTINIEKNQDYLINGDFSKITENKKKVTDNGTI